MLFLDIYKKLVSVDSTSGKEDQIKAIVIELLKEYKYKKDKKGNLIFDIEGSGDYILLNAHLDRVPLGKGHKPTIKDDTVYSDKNKTTNSGADDAVGIAIIISILANLKNNPHRSLKIIFTVEEEIGLFGAKAIEDQDLKGCKEGIVIDNAFSYKLHQEGGVIVDKGAAIYAFNLEIIGKGGHSGKDLSNAINVLDIWKNLKLEFGSLEHDTIRINIGNLVVGEDKIRNKIPESLIAYGEIRSVKPDHETEIFIKNFISEIESKIEKLGGKCTMQINKLADAYFVSMNSDLLKNYSKVLNKRNTKIKGYSTYIGSDCQAFRSKGINCFTLSTGVDNEHTVNEEFSVRYAEQIVNDLVNLLIV